MRQFLKNMSCTLTTSKLLKMTFVLANVRQKASDKQVIIDIFLQVNH